MVRVRAARGGGRGWQGTEKRQVWDTDVSDLWVTAGTHCKDKMPKILNKYSQERNIGASVPCNFHIHVSVRELYIPTMGLPFLLEEICGPILGIYKSLTDI